MIQNGQAHIIGESPPISGGGFFDFGFLFWRYADGDLYGFVVRHSLTLLLVIDTMFDIVDHSIRRGNKAMKKPKKKPNGYWTKERCVECAKGFTSISAWRKSSPSAYSRAHKKGWLNACCGHMQKQEKARMGFWSKEACIADAQQYETATEWRNASPGADRAARRNNWTAECLAHMTRAILPPNYWDEKRCVSEAEKYASSAEWRKASVSSYDAAVKNGWLEVCRGHMDEAPRRGFDASKPGVLYYLRVVAGSNVFYKVGITNRSVRDRYYSSDREKITTLLELNYEDGEQCLMDEQDILKKHSKYSYSGDPVIKSGNTELFTRDILGLDKELK